MEVISELKPCPFCGGKAKLKHIKGYGYYIRCDGVGCGLQVYTHPVKNKYKAIEVWNRRMR